jgi:hypothetical protein
MAKRCASFETVGTIDWRGFYAHTLIIGEELRYCENIFADTVTLF